MRLHELSFANSTSEETITLHVSKKSIRSIVSWYAVFYQDDDYSVYINGECKVLDFNRDLLKGQLRGISSKEILK
jgi:hypothetical protein